MKKYIISVFLLLFAFSSLKAQDCSSYVVTQEGKTAEYANKDKKGKIQSYHSQELISKTESDGVFRYQVLQISKDDKKEELSRDTLQFECRNGTFYVDMSRFIDENQTEAYEESQISVDFKDIGYPSSMEAGMQLEDGSVILTIDLGMATITNETKIINRKVEARESVSTPAGTFDCLKISQDVENKIGFATIKIRTVSWISEDVGTVKSESYDKKDRLTGTTELVSFK
jgi:hypothetical protein